MAIEAIFVGSVSFDTIGEVSAVMSSTVEAVTWSSGSKNVVGSHVSLVVGWLAVEWDSVGVDVVGSEGVVSIAITMVSIAESVSVAMVSIAVAVSMVSIDGPVSVAMVSIALAVAVAV